MLAGKSKTKYELCFGHSTRGKLAEWNATRGGATGRVVILRNRGDMAVPKAQGNRLSKAECLLSITGALSYNCCCFYFPA